MEGKDLVERGIKKDRLRPGKASQPEDYFGFMLGVFMPLS